ncbi:PWWP domain-containing protein [Heracleum sosnowskyi]|uniref:PWWP domain-containing protein n=1 Tax=Heracleum sosnowskyi TaxID=360622 RepID=A0AAD8H7B1_9APIA|nr:PWWP domain-containing protein [Heracleum sosnowskyi]
MNISIDKETDIKDLGEKIVAFDGSSDDNDSLHVKLIDGDEARVSNLMKVSKDEILGENKGLIDRVGVDAKVKERKEFSGGDGESSRVELSDSGVRKGEKGKERRMKRIEKVEKFVAGDGVKGSEFEIGDLVWGKVKSHPWWPGQIYNEKLASREVCKLKTAGYVLVAFFGDCSYGWFDPAELVRFESSYAEKSRQMSSRTFVKAVEEAVDEASRRRTLGLACRCRNLYNFRPTTVEGYVSVDVGEYESGSVYSVDQIRKSRDDFKPTEMLDFVNQLALSPIKVKHEDIEFVKNKATALAYRKAVYVEFDETYAQAFGYEAEHPSRGRTQGLNQPPKVANPAPLSGPLVIAEVLGKGKGSSKSCKSRERVKKDQYLFKRRDEINDLKTSVQVLPGQAASSEQPVYVDGSVAIPAGERAVQKKSTKVSKKHKASAKHQGTEGSVRDEVSDRRQEASGKGDMRDDKPSGLEIGHTDSQMNLVNSSNNKAVGEAPSQCFQAHEAKPFQHEGNAVGMKSQQNSRSEGGVGHAGINISDSVVDIPRPVDVKHEEAHLMAIKSVEHPEQSIAAKTEVHGEQAHDGSVGHPLRTGNAKSSKDGSDINNGIQAKKVKVRKRPAEKLNGDHSMPLMKKKRKKEPLSTENVKSSLSGGEVEPSVQSIAKSPVHVAISSREDLHVEPQGRESKILFETILAQKMVQVEKIALEPPELLHSLKVLAHSFTGGSNSSMAAVRQAFLRYRSLVFEKSLVLLPATGNDVRERRLIKPHRQVARPDDPSKGGLKRGPSDRQEEIAAKKKKKIDDMIELKAKKKAAQKTPVMQQGDVIKEASGLTMKLKPAPLKGARGPTMKSPKPPLTEASGPIMKSLKPAPLKKTEPSPKALGPMMLVMKFPPQGTLPSIMELKARFARFGQLDHSATRIYWKTSTCRLVYRRRVDAEEACRFASSTRNLFGNTDVRCYTREVEVTASVAEQGKVHKEDSSMGTSQLTDSAVEQRAARPLRTLQQPGGQPKSILKKSNGDETGGTNGGGKGTRVRFNLVEEETNRGGEQLIIGTKNINNNASFVDGGASSSTNHGLDFNSKNIVIPTSPMPILPVPTAVNSLRPPNYLHHTELAPRNGHNFNSLIAPSMTPSLPNVDISQQMMGLLNKCNDVVNKVTDFLGYVPLHPL